MILHVHTRKYNYNKYKAHRAPATPCASPSPPEQHGLTVPIMSPLPVRHALIKRHTHSRRVVAVVADGDHRARVLRRVLATLYPRDRRPAPQQRLIRTPSLAPPPEHRYVVEGEPAVRVRLDGGLLRGKSVVDAVRG